MITNDGKYITVEEFDSKVHRVVKISEDERLDLYLKMSEADDVGDADEVERIFLSVPLAADYACSLKEAFGAEFLTKNNCNLSEVKEVYGEDWLNR